MDTKTRKKKHSTKKSVVKDAPHRQQTSTPQKGAVKDAPHRQQTSTPQKSAVKDEPHRQQTCTPQKSAVKDEPHRQQTSTPQISVVKDAPHRQQTSTPQKGAVKDAPHRQQTSTPQKSAVKGESHKQQTSTPQKSAVKGEPHKQQISTPQKSAANDAPHGEQTKSQQHPAVTREHTKAQQYLAGKEVSSSTCQLSSEHAHTQQVQNSSAKAQRNKKRKAAYKARKKARKNTPSTANLEQDFVFDPKTDKESFLKSYDPDADESYLINSKAWKWCNSDKARPLGEQYPDPWEEYYLHGPGYESHYLYRIFGNPDSASSESEQSDQEVHFMSTEDRLAELRTGTISSMDIEAYLTDEYHTQSLESREKTEEKKEEMIRGSDFRTFTSKPQREEEVMMQYFAMYDFTSDEEKSILRRPRRYCNQYDEQSAMWCNAIEWPEDPKTEPKRPETLWWVAMEEQLEQEEQRKNKEEPEISTDQLAEGGEPLIQTAIEVPPQIRREFWCTPVLARKYISTIFNIFPESESAKLLMAYFKD